MELISWPSNTSDMILGQSADELASAAAIKYQHNKNVWVSALTINETTVHHHHHVLY